MASRWLGAVATPEVVDPAGLPHLPRQAGRLRASPSGSRPASAAGPVDALASFSGLLRRIPSGSVGLLFPRAVSYTHLRAHETSAHL
eukprot:5128757-Alexandrium_andersonii.AAC.1